jgi:hypothetical protein
MEYRDMSLDACYERELKIYDDQLESGAMTQDEYDDCVQELEYEYGDEMRRQGY